MTLTSSRTIQYIIILLILTTIAGGVYHYFSARAAKINTTQTTFNTSGLVGYWTFDGGDVTSTTANDKSSSGLNATVSGATFIIGKKGQGVNFTNSTDKVYTASTAVLNTDTHTIAFWIRLNANSTYWGQILAYKAGGSDRSPGIWTYSGSNCIHWRYDPGNTGVSCGGPAGESTYFTIGQWYYVVGVKNGATFTFYVNGTQQAQPTVANPKTAGSAAIEMGQTSGYSAALVSLDDMRIYNRALSAPEIATLYTMGTATVNASTNALNTNGLVGEWSFDGKQTVWTSSSAATTLDTSGNNNTGTLTNMSQSTSPVPGKIGQALNFDGSNDYINMGNPAALQITTTALTLCAWVKVNAWNAPGSWPSIISKTDSSSPYGGYQLNIDAEVGQRFGGGVAVGTTWYSYRTNTNLSTNVLYHMCQVYNNVDVRMYVNGVLDSTPVAVTGNIRNNATANLSLGRNEGFPTNAYVNGLIDDVRVYNRALSAGEVADLYTMGTTTVNASTNALNTNGLVGEWSFDGKQTVWTSTTAATTLDTSGQNNTGTLTNMSQSTSPTPGKIGQAFYFDGSNDYVNVGTSSILNPQYMSAAAWVKQSSSPPNAWGVFLARWTGGNAYHFSAGDGTTENKLKIFINTTSGQQSVAITGTMSYNTWHHVAFTFDGANLKLYLDGVLNNSIAFTGTISSSADNTTFGAKDTSLGYPFNGSLDDVRIYNRVLSADEVASLYNAGR